MIIMKLNTSKIFNLLTRNNVIPSQYYYYNNARSTCIINLFAETLNGSQAFNSFIKIIWHNKKKIKKSALSCQYKKNT
jgi:hypothetical protein